MPPSVRIVARGGAYGFGGGCPGSATPARLQVPWRVPLHFAGDSASDEAAQGYDLLVMGTHGRVGISRAFLGSVTERVLRLFSGLLAWHRSSGGSA